MTRHRMPSHIDLLWPTLKALEHNGGSASIQELAEQIASDIGLPDEVLDVPHGDGPQSEFEYRCAWSRTWLKGVGAVENTARGVWAITEQGRGIENDGEVRTRIREWQKNYRANRKAGDASSVESPEMSWREELLRILQGMNPDAFERLCQRLLRESGFTKVEVTGKSGDGGIDGAGVLRVNLLSFHVRFQCKRYVGSVAASAIRDFRGAMVGRADKGLFITTGRFTKDAEREAVRDGAPAIDLIDGLALCDLLKELSLGVKKVEVGEPSEEFFSNI